MRKYLWAIIAGVCVVALLAVAGIIFIPKLFDSTPPPPSMEEDQVVLRPAHWWQAEITEQQRSSLATLWGKDITAAELLQALWPEVLQQMPQKAVAGYEGARINHWPAETYEEWHGQMICVRHSVPDAEGPIASAIYVGTHKSEEWSLRTAGDRGFTENNSYRVSLYTGVRLE